MTLLTPKLISSSLLCPPKLPSKKQKQKANLDEVTTAADAIE
jgi:hypothetical protein